MKIALPPLPPLMPAPPLPNNTPPGCPFGCVSVPRAPLQINPQGRSSRVEDVVDVDVAVGFGCAAAEFTPVVLPGLSDGDVLVDSPVPKANSILVSSIARV
jgi:hypothetical protein